MGTLICLPTARSPGVEPSNILEGLLQDDLLSNQINESLLELSTSFRLLLRLTQKIVEHIDTVDQAIDTVTDLRQQKLLRGNVAAFRKQLSWSARSFSQLIDDQARIFRL